MAPWLRRVAPGALLVAACDLAFPLHEEPPQITYACGPSLRCSVSNINVGCCVITNVSTGSPPSNYEYECVTDKQCAIDRGDPADAGPAREITCDNASTCPGDASACCWPSTSVPTVTYCFPTNDINCAYELCDPDAAAPCVDAKHVGWKCVPSSNELLTAPLGYNVCAPADAG
jgi:hypothetical protein